MLVGALFKKFGLFLNTSRVHIYIYIFNTVAFASSVYASLCMQIVTAVDNICYSFSYLCGS